MPSRLDQIRAQLTSSAPSPTLGSDVAYVLKLVDELAADLEEIACEQCCGTSGCSVDDPLCSTSRAKHALAKLNEPADD